MKPTLVTSYVNPDLDGTACAIAYAELLTKIGTPATAGIFGGFHVEARFVLDRFKIPYPPILKDGLDVERAVVVDMSRPEGLEGLLPIERIIEVIDHRKINALGLFPNAKLQIELVGAAATLIAERFIREKQPISEGAAVLLYGAIFSNTLNFKSSVATDRDREAVLWLQTHATIPDTFIAEMFRAKSDLAGGKLKEGILSDISWRSMKGNRCTIGALEIIGVKALMKDRLPEMLQIVAEFKETHHAKPALLTLIDLEEGFTAFVTGDRETQELLQKTLPVSFTGGVARYPQMLMRKQLFPLLEQVIEGEKV